MTSPADPHPLADDQRLRRRLLALARRWLAHEAEDLVQEAWLRAMGEALPGTLDSREAWLVTVLRHLCIDGWRREARHLAALERLARDGAVSAEGDAPEHRVEQARRVEQGLLHLVRAVPPGEAAAVLLHEVFGFSHAELGVLTGRSEAAARQHLHRALRRLRRADPAYLPEHDDSQDLLALCRLALAQREPAGLVAVLRASRPQAMALAARGVQPVPGDASRRPGARLVQLGNLLALEIQAGDGPATLLPLGLAVTEAA